MKGGSVSSDNVVAAVKPGAFGKMDANFTNVVGGGKKGKKTTNKKEKSTKSKKGGMCPMCGGESQKKGGSASAMLHMNDLDDSGLFNLHNKKGGQKSTKVSGSNALVGGHMPTWWDKLWNVDTTIPPPKISADYQYNITGTSKPTGPTFDRSIDQSTIDILSSEPASQLGNLAKTIQYGDVQSSITTVKPMSSPFTYAQGLVGGKKKSAKKTKTSKKTTADKKSKKSKK